MLRVTLTDRDREARATLVLLLEHLQRVDNFLLEQHQLVGFQLDLRLLPLHPGCTGKKHQIGDDACVCLQEPHFVSDASC